MQQKYNTSSTVGTRLYLLRQLFKCWTLWLCGNHIPQNRQHYPNYAESTGETYT